MMTEAAAATITAVLPDIIRDAATLREVLSRRPGKAFPVTQAAEEVLQQWASIAAHGDRGLLAKRLGWDNWSPERLAAGLASSSGVSPPWSTTLRDLMIEAASKSSEPISFAAESDEALPFEDLWLPALRMASRKLQARHGTLLPRLAATAWAALLRSLLKRLVFLSSRVLAHEFDRFRPESATLLARWLGGRATGASRQCYQQFIARFRDDGHVRLFLAYPVLGRLAAELIDQWLDAEGNFLAHLEADTSLLEQTFHESRPMGELIEVDSSLSDPHHGGRVVHGLRFASGLRLIYKPKSLGLENAFQQLLAWCHRDTGLLPFQVLGIIDGGDHGWVEFVPWVPLADEDAARRFYERAGQLLCVIDLLRGKDCHLDNVRACGENLVLIDGEALAHPEPGGKLLGETIGNTPWQQLTQSVARTGLLPCWEFGANRRVTRDISGLGSVTDQSSLIDLPRWHEVNTDRMLLVHERKLEPPRTNVPLLGGRPLDPQYYLEQINRGFERMYRRLMRDRAELLAPAGPLAAFADQPVRFIYRATQVYQELLYRSFAPECLANGLVRSMNLDVVFRPHLADERPPLWPIVSREIEELEHLDIPAFYSSTSHRNLPLGPGAVLEDCFQSPSHEDIYKRLNELSEADLADQRAIITGSFLARSFKLSHVLESRDRPAEALLEPLRPDELVSAAEAIAESIEAQAIRDGDGGAAWLNLSYDPLAERYHLQPAPLQLYDGGLGVAQFMALLGRADGRARWHDLARAALRPVLRQFQVPRSDLVPWAQAAGIGAALGVTSLVHGLARVSQWLGDPALLDEARNLAQLLTPELIAADRHFDIMSGSAGAILGLLTLWEATGDRSLLAQAEQCGEQLLEHRVPGPAGTRTWRTLGPEPLTGFSHGAAGIAYALLRLTKAMGGSHYREAAQSAIAFERSLFVPEARNWPDRRPSVVESGHTLQAMGWCHGAPGIGLARIGAWEGAQDEVTQQEVGIALTATRQASLEALDHLCCGSFGRMDLLVEASKRFQQPGLLELARRQAAQVIARAHRQGGFTMLPGWSKPVFCCGLFQGYSGIGYQMLRLADPGEVPSVLLWQ